MSTSPKDVAQFQHISRFGTNKMTKTKFQLDKLYPEEEVIREQPQEHRSLLLGKKNRIQQEEQVEEHLGPKIPRREKEEEKQSALVPPKKASQIKNKVSRRQDIKDIKEKNGKLQINYLKRGVQ